MQNNSHYAVQGHSRSQLLYQLKTHLCPNLILSRTVSKILQSIGQIFAVGRRVAVFSALIRSEPVNSGNLA